MVRILIWDLPTRLFHWMLAIGVLAAFGIAQFAGEDSPLFPYHSLVGVILGVIVLLRIAWGLAGTRYAKFCSFLFSPLSVIAYMKGVATGGGVRHLGHNPGSSYAIFLMLALVLLIATTGLLMGGGNEAFEDIHSIAAYGLIAVVVVHVAGVLIHTIRFRENITASMFIGTKQGEASESIQSAAPISAAIFMVVVSVLAAGLFRNYDVAARRTTVPMTGIVIHLGEVEGENGPTQHKPGNDD